VDEAANEAMMREVLQDYMQKAHAYKSDLGDKQLTVEHVMLAMAEVRNRAGLPGRHRVVRGRGGSS
jgi:hypothetical protein